MSNITVGPDQFVKVLTKEINNLLESKEKRINELVDKYSELILNEIKITAPRSGRNKRKKPLADSFIVVKKKLFDSVESTIFSSNSSSYAHHIEFGTVTTQAQPYLRPAYDKYIGQFENEIVKILKDGKV